MTQRPHSPQTARRRRKKGTRNTKKAQKGAFPDIWQILFLAIVIMAISVVVLVIVYGVVHKKAQQADVQPAPHSFQEAPLQEMLLPKEPVFNVTAPKDTPLQDKPPADVAIPKTPQEKQPPAVAKQPAVTANPKTTTKKAPAPQPPARQPAKSPVAAPVSRPALPPEPPPQPQYRGTLVFVIDDAGNNLQELEPFLRFPGPLTIAVLPGLPHSAEAARRIRAAGKEVFLHQPMEAVGGQPPGPKAIYAGMTAAEIVALLNQNVAEIGPVAGMNNHQGSKITMDQQIMETVLAFCREQRICFLDSRTTAETAVPAAARNLGIAIGERNIFIDNEQNRLSMSHSIENGLALASQKGSAVMIGHTSSPALAPLLTELYQGLIAQGYEFATASGVIR